MQQDGVPETQWKALKFQLPFQENKFGKQVGYEIPCAKDKDILGGVMHFYCNPDGKWSSGPQECTWAKPEPVAPPAKPKVKAVCKKAKFNVEVNGKRLQFMLPDALESGKAITKDCGAEMVGEITFECDEEEGQWGVGDSSCKQKNACQPTNFGLSMSFGKLKFKLPLGQPKEEVVLPCKDPASSGSATFLCEAGEGVPEPRWALQHAGTDCQE